MAEGKKSFIAYSDWKDTFEALPDDKAGALIKHIFRYVSDENPTTDDVLINAVFANIKNTLKRDLKKWEGQYQQRVKAGKKSAEVRRRNSTSVNERSVSSTVNVSVSGSVSGNGNVNDILLEKETKELFDTWVKYRKEIKKPIKSNLTLNRLAEKIKKEGRARSAEVINNSITNGWQGLFWDKKIDVKKEKENAGVIAKKMIYESIKKQ